MDFVGFIILGIYGILILILVIGIILKIIERIKEGREDKYKDVEK